LPGLGGRKDTAHVASVVLCVRGLLRVRAVALILCRGLRTAHPSHLSFGAVGCPFVRCSVLWARREALLLSAGCACRRGQVRRHQGPHQLRLRRTQRTVRPPKGWAYEPWCWTGQRTPSGAGLAITRPANTRTLSVRLTKSSI